ncbi:type II toxin-antitoxin system VapC family toxin [Glaciibacter superstes]|uniref:type II toxin-antitoxin system VapC family toxin n=1 Tax=Glaciibacter superstes TaxID=501023 RepID=UPI0003B4B477|nr:type II toxin-antitoxin system VapC family toxin [Glaciibacter superstes]
MIYLDSCILIYAVEDDGERGIAVRQNLADAADETVAISPLVTLECLVKPLRDENLSLHDHYLAALDEFQQLSVDESHFIRAAELRARYGLKTPEALHLAVAQLSGCDQLWTNDGRLASASRGLAVDVINSPR